MKIENYYNKSCRYYTKCGKTFFLRIDKDRLYYIDGFLCFGPILGLDLNHLEIIKEI